MREWFNALQRSVQHVHITNRRLQLHISLRPREDCLSCRAYSSVTWERTFWHMPCPVHVVSVCLFLCLKLRTNVE